MSKIVILCCSDLTFRKLCFFENNSMINFIEFVLICKIIKQISLSNHFSPSGVLTILN